MKKINFKKKLSLLVGMMATSQIVSAQSFSQRINTGLNDYIVPVVILIIVVSVIYGAISNWKDINDPHKRKEGFMNIGMILLYAAIFIGAIYAVMALTTGLSIQI